MQNLTKKGKKTKKKIKEEITEEEISEECSDEEESEEGEQQMTLMDLLGGGAGGAERLPKTEQQI